MAAPKPRPAPAGFTARISHDGSVLILTVPLKTPAAVSASGKSLMVASSGGNVVTEATHEGKAIVVGVNAFVPVEPGEGA